MRKWGGVYEFYNNILMVSLTINVALLAVIYIQYVNKTIDKE